MMQAMQIKTYGQVPVQLVSVPVPAIEPTDVLVAVKAAGVNPIDFKTRNGEVKLLAKHQMPLTLGHEFAGVIVKVGGQVKQFKVGDEVYGRPRDSRIGTFAEYLAVDTGDIALKPQNLSFIEAAGLPLVGLTSYQALVDIAHIQAGQKILIQAGAGGVGSIAIQLAKSLGAYVATTASPTSTVLVKRFGADKVINYHQQDFSQVLHGYDLVFDTLGHTNLKKAFRILKSGGRIVSVSGLPNARFARQTHRSWRKAVLFGLATLNLTWWEQKYHVRYDFLFMKANGAELAKLTNLIEQGKIKPLVDQVFPLAKTQAALDYSEKGRAHGKIIVKVAD
ncbi:NADP-dependent oxidoreductase [Loigolactobacillus backii]|nr:NADP-dependent oxidoreductase [Loigolactobacillus backii]MDA5387866.1 NADP-dependent oxidoreductase [Loigolactobacillus backii]MDA5390350.1 NADP-dependent oxidoreductase [Loigolactobacillus backii]